MSFWLFGRDLVVASKQVLDERVPGCDGPGDPLPHGHLGAAANLALWGSVFDDDDDKEADDL